MNNIIVGFDFSTGSANAVDLTIDIANKWKSDIRLVYVKKEGEDETPIREEIERRLKNAKGEIEQAGMYQYVVVNDDLQVALNQVTAIVTAEKQRTSRYFPVVE